MMSDILDATGQAPGHGSPCITPVAAVGTALIATVQEFKNLGAWLAVGADGHVTAYTGNVELRTDVAKEE